MNRIAVLAVTVCSLFAIHNCEPFTDGNFIITYAGNVTGNLNTISYPAFIAEVNKEGIVVQTIAAPMEDFEQTDNGWMSGPNLSVDQDIVSFVAGPHVGPRKSVLLAANGTYQVYPTGGSNELRNFYHDGGLYIAGTNGVLTYNTLGSTERTTLVSGLKDIFDVFVHEGQLYATNYLSNTFYLGTVGTGTPTTSGNTVTTVIDNGTSFSLPELWLSLPETVIKGITFAPTTCHNGVQDGDEPDVDCAGSNSCPLCGVGQVCNTNSDCVTDYCDGTCQVYVPPVSEPVNTPMTAPIETPVSAPQSASTPMGKASSGLVSVQAGASTVLAVAILMAFV